MALTRRCRWCGDNLKAGQEFYCSRKCKGHATGSKAGSTPWKDHEYAPCGTSAARQRHRRRGEPPCRDCEQAESRDNHDRRLRRRAS